MRLIVAFAVAGLMLVSTPAVQAQEADPRPALAERYMQLAMAGNLDKAIRDAMTAELATLSDAMPPEEFAWFRDNASEILNRHIQVMVTDMTRYHAEHFTVGELEALIAFYDTPTGRAIAIKQMEMGIEQGRQMEAFTEGYVGELLTKYCAVFDCGAPVGAATGAAKPARR